MALNILNWQSIRTRVLLLTIGVLLVGLVWPALYINKTLRDDMIRMVSDQQLSTASLVAEEVNHELQDRLDTLALEAGKISQMILDNPPTLQKFITDRPAFLSHFNGGVVVYRVDGNRLASEPLAPGRSGASFEDPEALSNTLRLGTSTIGHLVIGKTQTVRSFAMLVPIRGASGQVIGVLAGVTLLDGKNFLDRITEIGYGRTGGFLLVAPQYRQIVTATAKRHSMEVLPAPGVDALIDRFVQGYQGSGISVNPEGIEMLVSAKRIPAAGWYVVASLPTDEALAPIFNLQMRRILAALLGFGLVAVLLWWMLRQQLAPMTNAVTALRAMSNEANSPQPLPVARLDEIGELIAGFNRLLETLKQRQEALQESEFLWKFAIEGSGDGVWDRNLQTGASKYSRRCKEMLGYDENDMIPAHREWVSRIHPDDGLEVAEKERAYLDGERTAYDVEYRLRCKNGNYKWILSRGMIVSRADHGTPLRMIGTHTDITERKQSEEKLQLAAKVFSHALEGIVITDPEGAIVDVNDAFTRITGYSRGEVLGKNPRLLSSGRQTKEFYQEMWHDLIQDGHWYGEIWNRRKNGEVYPATQNISAVRDAQGNTLHYVALSSDITAIKAYQQELERIARYDPLTKLPNRALLADRMNQALTQTQRRNQHLAVAFLDLDGFKAINDTHGHAAGDFLLVTVAERMKQVLRDGDTLARLGGDEFIAVLLDLNDVATSAPILNRLLAAVAQPVQFGEVMLQVSASLGVTFYPQAQEMQADQLLRQADQAMYQAKLTGKDRFQVFDSKPCRGSRDRETRTGPQPAPPF